jgi:hypothetical protein
MFVHFRMVNRMNRLDDLRRAYRARDGAARNSRQAPATPPFCYPELVIRTPSDTPLSSRRF